MPLFVQVGALAKNGARFFQYIMHSFNFLGVLLDCQRCFPAQWLNTSTIQRQGYKGRITPFNTNVHDVVILLSILTTKHNTGIIQNDFEALVFVLRRFFLFSVAAAPRSLRAAACGGGYGIDSLYTIERTTMHCRRGLATTNRTRRRPRPKNKSLLT